MYFDEHSRIITHQVSTFRFACKTKHQAHGLELSLTESIELFLKDLKNA